MLLAYAFPYSTDLRLRRSRMQKMNSAGKVSLTHTDKGLGLKQQ